MAKRKTEKLRMIAHLHCALQAILKYLALLQEPWNMLSSASNLGNLQNGLARQECFL